MLSKEVAARIYKVGVAAGDELKGKLPPLPDHPVRNSYAHVWREVKHAMGKSYLECEDSDEERILDLIRETVKNPR